MKRKQATGSTETKAESSTAKKSFYEKNISDKPDYYEKQFCEMTEEELRKISTKYPLVNILMEEVKVCGQILNINLKSKSWLNHVKFLFVNECH